MNPSPDIQAFVGGIPAQDLVTYRNALGVILEEADAALEEAEMALKYGGLNVAQPIETLRLNALIAKITVTKGEEILHAISGRITSLKLEGKAPAPATHTTNVASIQATCM